MTNLGCCVENCVHNEDNMCCRGNIKVDGHKAHDAGETCCASFQDCGCDASNCMYNNNMMCSAGHIDVKHSGNTVHGETECATFKMN